MVRGSRRMRCRIPEGGLLAWRRDRSSQSLPQTWAPWQMGPHPPWMVLSLNLTEAALLGSLRSEAQDTGLGGQLWDPAPPPSPAMVPAQASHVHGCHLFDPGHELGTGKLALQLSSYLIITPALICWYYYSHFTAGKTDAQRG